MQRAERLESCDFCGESGAGGVRTERARMCAACVYLVADIVQAREEMDAAPAPGDLPCNFCGVGGHVHLVESSGPSVSVPVRVCGRCADEAASLLRAGARIEVPTEPDPAVGSLDPPSGVVRPPSKRGKPGR